MWKAKLHTLEERGLHVEIEKEVLNKAPPSANDTRNADNIDSLC